MKKNNLKQLCMDYEIQNGNLKKNDLILLIVDYQQGIGSKEENDSDISCIIDDEKEEDSVDTSISFTSLKTTPIRVLDGEEAEIDVIEDDIIIETAYTSKEKTTKFIEMCSKLSFTCVVGYDITPNQSGSRLVS